MSGADYLVYDVFTATAFGGNQLAVFPDARGLPEDRLQAITREFNFSEVTFCYPAPDAAHTRRVPNPWENRISCKGNMVDRGPELKGREHTPSLRDSSAPVHRPTPQTLCPR